jgi:peptidoglycan/LPS O-acetylase OafA/YrhL
MRGERYEALDSLRGLAACWVVVFHLPTDGHNWSLPIVRNGFLAVTFFFVLSGFVIGASYARRLSQGYPLGKFMFLRWGRIYPLHAFMLGVMLLYEIIRAVLGIGAFREGMPFTGSTAPAGLFWNLALLQDLPGELSWNRPSWSIGVEYWTYLAAALALRSLGKVPLLLGGLLVMAPGAVVHLIAAKVPLGLPGELASLLACTMGFGLGLCVYGVRQLGWLSQWVTAGRTTATVIEVIAVLIVLAASWTFGGKTSDLIYPAFTFMVWVFSHEAGHVSRLLKLKPMLLLGLLSYSIYMVHQFIQDRLLDLIDLASDQLPLTVMQSGRIVLSGNPLLCDAVVAIMLLLVIGTSWLTYHYVEHPARQWSRRIAGKFGDGGKAAPHGTDGIRP